MSHWAVFSASVLKLFKRKSYLFFVHLAPGRLGLLFVISIFLTLTIANGNAIANMLFQSPQSPPAQPPPQQAPATEGQPADPITGTDSPQVPAEPAGNEPPPLVQPTPAFNRPEREDRFLDEEEDEASSSNFILDQVELVDTVVVSTAYVWLCCGIGLFLLIPLVFLFLQIRGRSKILREENY